MRQALDCVDHISIAIVGIGSIEPSRLLASSGNVFSGEELNALQDAGAVGDICLRFFDACGSPVSLPIDGRVVSIRLNQLVKASRVLAMAGGKRKVEAIRGALKGGLVNILFTDHQTAGALLE